MAMIANHGSKNKYYYDMVGVNSRLDELQAAILNVKLRYLDKIINLKQKVAEIYYNELSDIQFQGEKLKHATYEIPNEQKIVLPVISDRYKHTYHQFTIRLKRRDDLKTFLSLNGIQSMIYYPVPLHLQKAYKSLGYKEGDFPVSEQVSQEVLSLPIHPFLTEDQVIYITATIKKFLET
jgi:dTDP-4-amino-4,6-dideoxygalactose transaminase